jgi:demethylmenaquinone methyltransferase/2-methoxy-6-polyprenyl-1,4-benzoquinol methylase
MVKRDLPTGDDKTVAVRQMFDTIAPRYEMVNKVMTFGLDTRWRRRAVRDLYLAPGALVVDIAAGTGDFVRELEREGHRSVAVDLSYGMLAAGHGMSRRVQADASQLPFADFAFDGVTCGYALRNFTDLAATLREIGRVVRPGGRLSFLEVAEPESGLLKTGFRLWFRRAVPLVGSLLSNREAYDYLPRSTAYLPPRPELLRLFRDAGFCAVNHRRVMGGLSQQIIATKEGS